MRNRKVLTFVLDKGCRSRAGQTDAEDGQHGSRPVESSSGRRVVATDCWAKARRQGRRPSECKDNFVAERAASPRCRSASSKSASSSPLISQAPSSLGHRDRGLPTHPTKTRQMEVARINVRNFVFAISNLAAGAVRPPTAPLGHEALRRAGRLPSGRRRVQIFGAWPHAEYDQQLAATLGYAIYAGTMRCRCRDLEDLYATDHVALTTRQAFRDTPPAFYSRMVGAVSRLTGASPNPIASHNERADATVSDREDDCVTLGSRRRSVAPTRKNQLSVAIGL